MVIENVEHTKKVERKKNPLTYSHLPKINHCYQLRAFVSSCFQCFFFKHGCIVKLVIIHIPSCILSFSTHFFAKTIGKSHKFPLLPFLQTKWPHTCQEFHLRSFAWTLHITLSGRVSGRVSHYLSSQCLHGSLPYLL